MALLRLRECKLPLSLRHLDLSYNPLHTPQDLEPLAALEYLQSLTLIKNGLTSLEGVQLPASLRDLDLSYNELHTPQDLKPLAGTRASAIAYANPGMALLRSRDCSCLSSLLKLDLSCNRLQTPQDLEPLAALVRLQSLTI